MDSLSIQKYNYITTRTLDHPDKYNSQFWFTKYNSPFFMIKWKSISRFRNRGSEFLLKLPHSPKIVPATNSSFLGNFDAHFHVEGVQIFVSGFHWRGRHMEVCPCTLAPQGVNIFQLLMFILVTVKEKVWFATPGAYSGASQPTSLLSFCHPLFQFNVTYKYISWQFLIIRKVYIYTNS